MRPEIRLTPPRRAKRRMAGLVMPWMLSRRTFRCLCRVIHRGIEKDENGESCLAFTLFGNQWEAPVYPDMARYLHQHVLTAPGGILKIQAHAHTIFSP